MFEQINRHRSLSTKIMTSIIRLSLIGMIVASFVVVGILSAQSSLVSNARPSARAKTTGDTWNAAKPTIVLVHSAFADATSWQHVIPILERHGYNVIPDSKEDNMSTTATQNLTAIRRGIEETILVSRMRSTAATPRARRGSSTRGMPASCRPGPRWYRAGTGSPSSGPRPRPHLRWASGGWSCPRSICSR